MGVQLPRSPVRLSLFRCSSLFVSLSVSLCFVVRLSLFRCSALLVSLFGSLCSVVRILCSVVRLSLFCCPTPSLDWSCSLSFARVPYIFYLFFYMGVKSGGVASMISWEKPFPHPRRFFGFNTSCFWR